MRIWMFVVAVLLVGNVVMYKNRNRFEYRQSLSYNDLYARESGFPIKKFEHRGKGRLFIIGESDSAVLLQLAEGTHNYTVFFPPDSVMLVAEYLPAAPSEEESVTLYDIDADLEKPSVRSKCSTEIDPQVLSEARQLLRDSILVRGEKTTEQKVAAISIFLHNRIFASRGQPSAAVLNMNPVDAYRAACHGEKIYCSVYAKIFDVFARAAGIRSQVIEIRQPMPGVVGSIHAFNQYFDEERRAYAMTDLTFNVVWAENAAGKKLNAVDFKNADPKDSSIRILIVAGDSLKSQSYAAAEPLMHVFYGREKDLCFYFRSVEEQYGTFAKRLETYLLPRPWYGVYSDIREQDNFLFYFKQGMVALLAVSIVFMVVAYISKKRQTVIRRRATSRRQA